MAAKLHPPQATIRRLSFYLRCLNSLEEKGIVLVSSHQLANLLFINPAQVRKDLAYFGEFGKRGVGYSVPKLRDHLIKILGLTQSRVVGIVGAGGYLGHALSWYKGFEKRNFKVVALFDKDPQVIGETVGTIGPILPITELPRIAKELSIEILILTVPESSVAEVFGLINKTEVKAVLNFAPVKLASTKKIVVHNVDLALELESLSYHLGKVVLDEGSPLVQNFQNVAVDR